MSLRIQQFTIDLDFDLEKGYILPSFAKNTLKKSLVLSRLIRQYK